MKSINMQGAFFFRAGLEFSNIGKHDVTFIREMRVHISLVHMKFIKKLLIFLQNLMQIFLTVILSYKSLF